MVTVGHNPKVSVYNRIPTEWEETAKLRLGGDIQCDVSYWRLAGSNFLPPEFLWQLWRSASTLTQPFRPDRIVFCWCSRLQNWHPSHPNRHLFHPVTMTQLITPKSKMCHPDMCISIPLFPVLNFSILMQMPRIASVLKILIQICWLKKEHPLVSTLSAAW